MFIIDTDHIGILQRQAGSPYQRLSQRIAGHSQTDFYVAIVSFHEQMQPKWPYSAAILSTSSEFPISMPKTGRNRLHSDWAWMLQSRQRGPNRQQLDLSRLSASGLSLGRAKSRL